MDEGQKKARGRARGRARGQPPAAGQSSQPAQAPVPRPTPTSSASSSSVPALGRSIARGGPSAAEIIHPLRKTSLQTGDNGNGKNGGNGNGNGNGNGSAAPPIGRGSIRGGKFIDPSNLYTRPTSVSNAKQGKSGQVVKIQTNFFKLTARDKWSLIKYHVDFNPEEDRTFMRKQLLRNHTANFIGAQLFDGSTIFSVVPLCPEGDKLELYSERPHDNAKIRITIKKVGTCEPGDFQNVQVFNIIMRECMKSLKLQEIRRNYYDPTAKTEIKEFRLELWPGYVTSIGQYERDILLNAEINFKVLRMDTAYDLFRQIVENRNRDFKNDFQEKIVGCIVLTKYNNKTYRVTDVDFNETPESTFPKKSKDGIQQVSYVQYYDQVYGLRINDTRQPLLISKSSARQMRSGQPEFLKLIPEFCVMTGFTDEMRSNYPLMREQAKHTSVAPSDRINRLLNFGKRLLSNPKTKETLERWGMNLAGQLVEIDGRVLPAETINMAENVSFGSGPEVDWTKNLRNNKMLLSVDLKSWLLVYPVKLENQAKDLFRLLQQVGRSMHFHFPEPVKIPLQNDTAGAYMTEIDKGINQYNPQLVLTLVPNNRSDRYSAIKKKCTVEKPVPSQVVLSKSVMSKGNMSIATKIAIQINCKIGGAPWSVPVPVQGLMVVGFDVCHDPRDKRRSYGAMVATLDRAFARYHSSIKHHSAGEELSSNFGESLRGAVEAFYQLNHELPRKIVIYRDGVGDGNLKYVYEHEIVNIKNSLKDLYAKANAELKMAVVIVSKRINVRLFCNRQNPAPGTVVDDVITNPFRYDFFLVSQSVRQGTVSPTHYNVIHDNSDLQPEHIQRLTYKLTHMYFNWSGTVRVPAPCQYAHKLAFLTAQSVGVEHTNLRNLLYFL